VCVCVCVCVCVRERERERGWRQSECVVASERDVMDFGCECNDIER
jgi:hypothetical protein